MINRFIYKIIVFTVIFFSFSYVMAENLEYVDLGLSVKWANMNVGASKITDFGNYYAWAETSTKEQYDWTTYKYTEKGATRMTKYNSTSMGAVLDFLTELEPIDDAATINWGNDWRMPTRDEFRELFDYTNNEWISNYKGTGVNGRKFTSKKNGNSIFIPASGYRLGSSFRGQGRGGDVWSSSLNAALPGGALELGFGSGSIYMGDSGRYYGLAVRGVMD